MKLFSILIIAFCGNFVYPQSYKIKVLKAENIKFYTVLTTIDLQTNDSLILLGCKANNKDFGEINLEPGKEYNVKTRLVSSIKVKDDEYLFLHPAITVIDNIPISTKGHLPIIITNFDPIIIKD